MHAPEIVVVANRLPALFSESPDGQVKTLLAPGGLVSALAPIAKRFGCTWVGAFEGSATLPQTVAGVQIEPVAIDPGLFAQYYEGFANQVLWPIFHGLPEYAVAGSQDPGPTDWWQAYQSVNLVFAKRIAETAGHAALVWVHDYHLLLVPGLLRDLRPDLRVAVFLHIPFPSLELLVREPWAKALVQGLTAAGLVGVQREVDATLLRAAARAFGGASSDIRVFPISIESGPFVAAAKTVLYERADLGFRDRYGGTGRKLLLSVDRLDYTKGIFERIAAFAEVLASWSNERPLPVLVQVVTPTRQGVPAYCEYASRVSEAVESVRERFRAPGYEPIMTISTSLGTRELASAFLAADVLCVTPLRDGMNLVAKEFVASRVDEGGVLVLSRDAGAADELTTALTVDSSDQSEMVAALREALEMAPDQATARMRAMRSRVISHDVHLWAESFLAEAVEATCRVDTVL